MCVSYAVNLVPHHGGELLRGNHFAHGGPRLVLYQRYLEETTVSRGFIWQNPVSMLPTEVITGVIRGYTG